MKNILTFYSVSGIDDDVVRKRVRNIFNPTTAECLQNEEIIEISEKLENEIYSYKLMLTAVSVLCALLMMGWILTIIHLRYKR